MIQFPDVTRVEIIDQTGRIFVSHGNSNVELSLQDEERTLKVFLYSGKGLDLEKSNEKQEEQTQGEQA